jgi:hypothetical protein
VAPGQWDSAVGTTGYTSGSTEESGGRSLEDEAVGERMVVAGSWTWLTVGRQSQSADSGDDAMRACERVPSCPEAG